jgi:hypothetical protein
MRNIWLIALAGLLFADHGAAAMELDTLLPPGIPGLGEATPLTVIGRLQNQDKPIPLQYGALSLAPKFSAGLGYDSAPDGAAAGTALFSAAPSMIVTDIPAGFGAYIGANTTLYPADAEQNIAGYTVAAGEAAVFPQETLTLAGGLTRTAQTGFGLNTFALNKPIAFTAGGISAGDKILAGMFTLAPSLAVTTARFDALPAENVTQWRGRFGLDFAPGGPLRVVSLFEATQSSYRTPGLNSQSYAALAGIDEDATGLWEFRLLGGTAWRVPAAGAPPGAAARAIPVLEAAATWLPTELDSVSADLAHEIDDPDQIGPNAYTLTRADLSYTHEMAGNIDVTGTFEAEHAAYFGENLVETLYDAGGNLGWHVNKAVAFNLAYAFNDRQSNFSAAANEHVVTFNAVFTP